MIIDGKSVSSQILNNIASEIKNLEGRNPCLAVILVGDDKASKIYVDRKTKACDQVGIKSIKFEFPASLSEESLLNEIEKLNEDHNVDGILVQLPLPPHINPNKITEHINFKKDVDGFHPINMGKLLIGEEGSFQPCTPLGIKVLLEKYNIDIVGKHIVILGRSNIVGKPMAAMLIQNTWHNVTVTMPSKIPEDLKAICSKADILITAIGQPKFITAEMVKEGAVVIDVGINKIDNDERESGYQIVGDVDYEKVKEKCSYITPVPGGVGPMTIAMLLNNTLKAWWLNNS